MDSQYLPFYNAPLEIQDAPQSTPVKSKLKDVHIDLDQKLNTSDVENLQDMSVKLPSEVQKEKTFQDALNTGKRERYSIEAQLGKAGEQKLSDKERQILESRKATLAKI